MILNILIVFGLCLGLMHILRGCKRMSPMEEFIHNLNQEDAIDSHEAFKRGGCV